MANALGRGIYTFAEAAALTGLRSSRVREWFRKQAARASRRSIFVSDYESVDGDHPISFHDLIDVYVAGQLREHGVSLPTVRTVYARLADDFKTPHPFCRLELVTDGKRVLLRGLDAKAQEKLTDLLTRRRVYDQVLLPFFKKIDYDDVTLLARRWHLADLVVLDPGICFGTPIVEAAGIPTSILAAAYQANGKDAGVVARWYHVQADQVKAAAEFEKKMVA